MATLGLAPIQLLTTSNHSCWVRHGKEEVSMSYKAGAPLVNDTGQVEECGADPTNLVGFALHDASGVENSDVMFVVPREDDEIEATLTTSAFAYALLGTELENRYGLAKDATTGFWYIDQAETTADVVVITGFVSPIGTVNPRVRARLLRGVLNAA